MNLSRMLAQRAEEGRPVRVGLIGCGKFGTMFMAQARSTRGLHVLGVADLRPERVRESLRGAGWPAERFDAADFDAALRAGTTHLTDDADALIRAPELDVLIEATGDPAAGTRHALAAIEHGRHVVMVTVEADVLTGPLIAERARRAGVVYSLAYGDQPALICELVDWARASGFEVVAAGKGTKYLTRYHQSTPETVWTYFGITPERAALGGMNAKMFNSFVDGTKSAIEMAAVANAAGLDAPDGLSFPPCGAHDLARVLRPVADGGQIERPGMVEVISSLERDGRPVVGHIRQGVYVVYAAGSDYTARCFEEYEVVSDDSHRYAALYRPFHLIGLELGISVASAALRGEPTGSAQEFRADVVATAKRDLAAGETLDGEGGFTVYGRIMPAADSLRQRGLPLGLAHGVRLTRPVRAGAAVTFADVEVDEASEVLRLRREMETAFAPPAAATAAAAAR